MDEIASILKQVVKDNGAPLFLLEGLNTDSQKICTPAFFGVAATFCEEITETRKQC